jgi:RimJ/RimL family protein N-acetyltransferase
LDLQKGFLSVTLTGWQIFGDFSAVNMKLEGLLEDMNHHNIWQGELVRLRAVEPEDWTVFSQWDLDSDMARECYWVPFPKSHEAARKHALDSSLEAPKDDNFNMVIENEKGEFVGVINPHECDSRNGTFKYGLAIRREYQRRGYASETIRLVLRYFFEELRYQKVTVEVYDFNEASIKLHEKLGYQHEGRIRRMYFSRGQYHDSLTMGMTVEEWREKYRK